MAIGAGTWRNWGRNQQCAPTTVDEPSSVLEVIEAVQAAKRAGHTVKVVGSGHSFTDIACTDGRLLRIDALDRVLDVDYETNRVTVEAGMRLAWLNHQLALRGLALDNLGDIDRQTIAGALSTSTHGTGLGWGSLASFVVGMELVTADGEILRCSADEEPEVLACARVSLGALGVVTKYTLQCVPAFRLHSLEKPYPLDEVVARFDEICDSNEHVDGYWWPYTDVCTLKCSNRTDAPVRVKPPLRQFRDDIVLANFVFGAVTALGRARPTLVPRLMGTVASGLGKAERVDESYKVFCSTRLVRFVEMEYELPRAELVKTLLRVRELIGDRRLVVDFPVELRVTGPDDIPLSTTYGRESAYLAVHMSAGRDFDAYFHGVESIMDEVGGRPHWGKMHYQDASTLAPRYPEWERFRAVRARLDPEGRFRNAYLDRVLGLPA